MQTTPRPQSHLTCDLRNLLEKEIEEQRKRSKLYDPNSTVALAYAHTRNLLWGMIERHSRTCSRCCDPAPAMLSAAMIADRVLSGVRL